MRNSKINVWQINLHKANNASILLQQRLSSETLFLGLIQEPCCKGNTLLNIPRNAKAYTARLDSNIKPRAAILVSKEIPSRILPEYCDRDTVAVSCDIIGDNGQTNTVWWVSSYMPGDSIENPPPNLVQQISHHCKSNNIPLVICCDANAHHEVWNSTDTNARGESLLEFVASTQLFICNKGCEPTFVVQNRSEVLDLTLANLPAVELVNHWRVDSSASLSDHRYIRFDVDTHTVPHYTDYRNVNKTDWGIFREEVSKSIEDLSFDDLSNITEVNRAADDLTAVLNSSMDIACPKKRIKISGKPNKQVWWTKDLATLRNGVRKAHRLAMRSDTSEAWEAYRQASRTFKSATRKAKRGSWKNFCQQTSSLSASARLVKMLKQDKSTQLETVLKGDGSFTRTFEETLQVMMETHYPDSIIQQDVAEEEELIEALQIDSLDEVVTPRLVEHSIRSFKPWKAPSQDKVFPKMLQEAGDPFYELLAKLYKACLLFGIIPTQWTRAKVVFIPKPGKDTYYSADSYRPITLTSFFLKGLERLIMWHLQKQGILQNLQNNQFAYKPGFSTETALHQLVTQLEKAVFNKQFALGAFIDLVGAFSNVNHDAIRRALVHFHVDSGLTRWLMNMLDRQTVTASLGGASLMVRTTRGTPQGGASSPILFCLVMDELLRQMLKLGRGLMVQAYADDIVFIVSGIDATTCRDLIQRALTLMSQWAESVGLAISSRKTKVVMFTWKRKWHIKPLKLNGTELTLAESVKYLGVTLQHSLSWTPHVLDKITKAKSALMRCSRVVGKTWGLSPKNVLWIYVAIIRPMVSYAPSVWVRALELSTVRNKLNQLQRLACVCVTSAFPGTPTAALEMLIGLPPLHIYLQGEAVLSAFRLKCNGQWRKTLVSDTVSHKSHLNMCNKMMHEVGILLDMPSDVMVTTLNHDNKFVTEIADGREIPQASADTAVCYTDGSKLDTTYSGSGIYFPELSEDGSWISLGKTATVFQAEIIAIQQAAKLAAQHEHKLGNKSICIMSDSQAAIKALTKPTINSKCVMDCVKELDKLSNTRSVMVKWVKAHVGIDGNEKADNLAKEGAKATFFAPEPIAPVPYRSCRAAVRSWVQFKTSTFWTSLNVTCRQTKVHFPNPMKIIGVKALLNLDRLGLRHVIQVLTGHCNLAKHRHTTGPCVPNV